MKGRVTKTGYRRNSPDVNNDYNIIPSNRISMAGVDFPVLGIDNLGNAEVMYPGGEYEFQGDYVTELPAFGSGGLTQWFAEEWVDIKTGKKCGRSGKDKNGRPYPACRPSKRVNKTTPKTSKEMSAKEKAKFKKSKTSKKRINYNHKRAQEGIEVEPASRLIRYEDGRIKLQDPAIYDGMLDETTVTPYTQSELAFQEARANQATGGLEPIYPIFEVLSAGAGLPLRNGARMVTKKATQIPAKLMPTYRDMYRGLDLDGTSSYVLKNAQEFKHVSNNPNLRFGDIKTTDPISIGRRPKSGRRINRNVAEGNSDPRNALAGFYTTAVEKEIGERAAIAGSPRAGQSVYKFSMPEGARVLEIPRGTTNMSTGELKEAADMGYDLIRGNDLGTGVEYIPLNKNKMMGFNSSFKKQEGGENEDAMIGMMKARIALENEFGNNPAIQRLIVAPDNPYDFGDGNTGTHYMGSYGKYAIPNIQDVNGQLEMTGPRMNEAIRFDRDEDAEYFANENYKKVAPAFKKQKGGPAGTYTVKPGDTFYGIANRQGVDKEALVKANPNLKIESLKIGETIQLPGINKNYALKQGKVVSMSPELYEKTPDFYKNPKLDKPDLQKDNTNLSSFDNPRSKALLEAAKKVSEGQGGRPLEVLLNMSAWMESNLGLNPEAYNRTYTRGPMSIDDDAFKDVYDPRGDYGYTNSQKKGFEWLKGLGYEPAKMDSTLRADDPLAALATTRLIYGRATEPLPNPDNPRAVYDYYVDHYNKHGQDKYGTDEEHYARFLKGYNSLYNKKEEGGESIPSYDIYDNYNRAWLFARKKLGKNKLFKYGGRVCSTSTAKGL